MSETIIVSLITGGITLIGVIMSNNKHQAVIDTKIEELTREVREHNDFAKRIPVIESEIKHIKSNIQKLEKYHS
jgi:peptidoglycan hydrolase CwlO-like protein